MILSPREKRLFPNAFFSAKKHHSKPGFNPITEARCLMEHREVPVQFANSAVPKGGIRRDPHACDETLHWGQGAFSSSPQLPHHVGCSVC